MQAHLTHSEEETRTLAGAFARALEPGATVALSGDLGSGKTAWVRGMCAAYACEEQVSSPTFTIVNEYRGVRHVLHCDVYRLRSIDEMFEAGLDEMFDSDAVVLVEWAEKMLALLPFPRWEILCEHGGNEAERRYTVVLVADQGSSILEETGDMESMQ
ncbi:MAG: tRNA (adenosine(37)-N6)-threonylcarbamoyltransferase complex ATPase subunit type 1 TsaE [Ignavibacteriae bacterium]|nr:tRNA (adenosine(37)-N6)-threonylcarbamoyltransferase complex ATPase subunit type 1 TsaE [Ignavibacteriota bacterium]